MKTMVIVNPKSAHGRTAKSWPHWKRKIVATIGPFDESWTERPGDGELLTRKAIQAGYEHIHAVGGDGTIAEVVNGFFQEGKIINPACVLTPWPAGSGCDFLRSLHNPDSFTQTIPNGLSTLDVGHLTFRNFAGKQDSRYFINIASCGISGLVDQLMNQKGKAWGGRLGFLMNTVEALLRYDNRKVSIKTDQGDLGEHLIRCVAVGNGKYFGAGMKVAPQARLDDGTFQMVVLGDLSLGEALWNTPRLYSGKHVQHRKVLTQSITWAEISSDQEVLLDVDGEALGTLPIRIEVSPCKIRVKTY